MVKIRKDGQPWLYSSTLKNGHDSAICDIPPSRKLTTFKEMDAHPVICAFGKIHIKKWEKSHKIQKISCRTKSVSDMFICL